MVNRLPNPTNSLWIIEILSARRMAKLTVRRDRIPKEMMSLLVGN
jgi:hypothetical protein